MKENTTLLLSTRHSVARWVLVLIVLPFLLAAAEPARAVESSNKDTRTWDRDVPKERLEHRGTPLFDNVKTVLIRIIYYPVAYRDDAQELIPAALRREALQQTLTTAYKERFNSDAATLAKAHDNHWPLHYGRTNPTFVIFDENSRSPYFDLINQPDTLTVVLQVSAQNDPNTDHPHPSENVALDLVNYRPGMRGAPWSLLTHPISLNTRASESKLTSKLHEYVISDLMR